jgi:hypothetical protein
VAVEHIFSGGHDTISLRRASLKPSTIQHLMLIKHRLLLARRQYVRNLENEAQEAFIFIRGCWKIDREFTYHITLIRLFILPYTRLFYGYGVICPISYYALFNLRPYLLRPVAVFGRIFTVISVYGRCGALDRGGEEY